MRAPSIAAFILLASAAFGQDEIGLYMDQILASDEKELNVNGSTFSVVAADLITPATVRDRKAREAYLRVTQPDSSGWQVRVMAPDGTVMMTGHFADADLKVPHGPFAYYFVNGKLESRGDYVLGAKSGTWQRFTAWGTQLPDRIYDGGRGDDELERRRGNKVARTE